MARTRASPTPSLRSETTATPFQQYPSAKGTRDRRVGTQVREPTDRAENAPFESSCVPEAASSTFQGRSPLVHTAEDSTVSGATTTGNKANTIATAANSPDSPSLQRPKRKGALGVGRRSPSRKSPSADAYNRKLYGGWIDQDGDCQNTRHEVLIAESTVPVTLDAKGCRVVSGRWQDPYTGRVFTDPRPLDIDHFIPQAVPLGAIQGPGALPRDRPPGRAGIMSHFGQVSCHRSGRRARRSGRFSGASWRKSDVASPRGSGPAASKWLRSIATRSPKLYGKPALVSSLSRLGSLLWRWTQPGANRSRLLAAREAGSWPSGHLPTRRARRTRALRAPARRRGRQPVGAARNTIQVGEMAGGSRPAV